VLEWKRPCLDATQIEYVIGDVEEGASRHTRNADAMSAFGRQGLIAQHVDCRHQAMQLCTDFMTHHGDEMAAGALCGVHEVARALELRQHRLMAGHRLIELGFSSTQHPFTRLNIAS
jgi:hypothetical protein